MPWLFRSLASGACRADAAAKGGRALKLMYDVRSLVRVYLAADGSPKGNRRDEADAFGLPDGHTRLQSKAQATDHAARRSPAPGLHEHRRV